MPQTRVNLPPEALEAIGDIKGAAEGVKRELDKLERELTKDVLRGRKMDNAKASRVTVLRGRLDELSAKRESIEAARKEAKESVAVFLKNTFNAHNPHSGLRRLFRLNVTGSDFGALGDFLHRSGVERAARDIAGVNIKGSGGSAKAFLDATVKDLASRGKLSGTMLAKLGAQFQNLANDPAATARVFLASTAAMFAANQVDKYWENTNQAAEIAKQQASQTQEFVSGQRYATKLSPDELRRFGSGSRSAGNAKRELTLRGGFVERLQRAMGLGTPEADKAATQREQQAQEKFMLERQVGAVDGMDSSAVRRAAERELMLRIAGNGNSLEKAKNIATASLTNIATAGGTRRDMMETLEHEQEVKLLKAKAQKREAAMHEHQQDPIARTADYERTLHLRMVEEWKKSRALLWSPI